MKAVYRLKEGYVQTARQSLSKINNELSIAFIRRAAYDSL
jgi:hypothetical protein